MNTWKSRHKKIKKVQMSSVASTSETQTSDVSITGMRILPNAGLNLISTLASVKMELVDETVSTSSSEVDFK